MAGAAQRKPPPLSVKEFRSFLEGRPERERWELIDGVAIMMTPPTLAHQRIAGNLQRILDNALRDHAPGLMALQRLGMNVSPSVDNYDPEPDVAVVDAVIPDLDARYVDRFYLAAEVVSRSDGTWIHKKREIYKRNIACICILTVQQERLDVRVDLKVGHEWTHKVLTKAGDELDLPAFGLRCLLSEIYDGIPLRSVS